VQVAGIDPGDPVPLGVLTYELGDLGASTNVTLRMEFRQMNIVATALIWFFSRFGYHKDKTNLEKLKRAVEAEGQPRPIVAAEGLAKKIGSAIKVADDNDGGFKIVDFPLWVGAFTFPLSLFLLYKFVVHWSQGGDLKTSYGTLAGAALFAIVGTVLTKRSVVEFDVLRRQVVWSSLGVFGRKRGTIPFEKIKSAYVEQSTSDNSFSYRVLLSTEEGVVPLTFTKSVGPAGRDSCQQMSDKINRLGIGPAPLKGG
jgi:hypothetical protein